MTAAKPKPARVRLPAIRKGYVRKFVRCKTKGCGRVFYYDYVPYSLSNPIMTMPCAHGIGGRIHQTTRVIDEADFHRLRLAELARAAKTAKT